jgi:hypothetical protein
LTDERRSLSEAFRALSAEERLAATGALIVMGSLLLPWYGLQISGGIAKTGFGAFGWVEAALLISLGAALVLLYEHGHERKLPQPLHEGTLLVASGAWAFALVLYRMFDRPDFQLGPIREAYDLRYGIFIALGGAVLIVVAGLRRRRVELAHERRPAAGHAEERSRRG